MTSQLFSSIGVTTSFIGVHCWPDAPPHRAYLATPHRHKFGVRVEVEVSEHDREIEFHDLLDHVYDALPPASVRLMDARNAYLNMSCEHHADRIISDLAIHYPDRTISVSVDEDGECFATLTRKHL